MPPDHRVLGDMGFCPTGLPRDTNSRRPVRMGPGSAGILKDTMPMTDSFRAVSPTRMAVESFRVAAAALPLFLGVVTPMRNPVDR